MTLEPVTMMEYFLEIESPTRAYRRVDMWINLPNPDNYVYDWAMYRIRTEIDATIFSIVAKESM